MRFSQTYLSISVKDPEATKEQRLAAYATARKSRVRTRFHITDMKGAKQAALKLTVKTRVQWGVSESMDLILD